MKKILLLTLIAAAMVLMTGPAEAAGCQTGEHCPAHGFCKKEIGACQGEGVCTPRPANCPPTGQPVCGCDNQTYSNRCFAHRAGVNIASEGACPELVSTCESCCRSDDHCSEGQYCNKADGDCDGCGECKTPGDACGFSLDPVCGCNGESYSNSCWASVSGHTSVRHEGECEEGGDP